MVHIRAILEIRNRVNKLMEADVGKYSKIINIRLSSVVDPDSLNQGPDPDPGF
jgi:hypothetical protein